MTFVGNSMLAAPTCGVFPALTLVLAQPGAAEAGVAVPNGSKRSAPPLVAVGDLASNRLTVGTVDGADPVELAANGSKAGAPDDERSPISGGCADCHADETRPSSSFYNTLQCR